MSGLNGDDIMAPRVWARVAGICWLVCIFGGLFAEAYVRSPLMAQNAATTVQNILAHEAMYRLGNVALFIGTAAYLILSAIMYRLLAPVSCTTSLIAAYFSVVGCTIWIFTLVFDSAPLVVFSGMRTSSEVIASPLLSTVFALLKLHSKALLLGMLCFGAQCLLMGWLILRATFLPKLLGALLALGGLGYLVAGFLNILSPPLAAEFAGWAFLPGQAGEAIMALWLTIAGVNGAKWTAKANMMASSPR